MQGGAGQQGPPDPPTHNLPLPTEIAKFHEIVSGAHNAKPDRLCRGINNCNVIDELISQCSPSIAQESMRQLVKLRIYTINKYFTELLVSFK